MKLTGIQWLLRGAAVASAATLLLRGVAGPFQFVAPVHNPLNVECALALSTIALLVISRLGQAGQAGRAGRGDLETWDRLPARLAWPILLVAAVSAVAYLPILSMPLVTDDYIHLEQISSGQAPNPVQCLTHSCGGPQFFRPVGFATYWAEWELWDTAALPRHAFDLLLHVASSVLFLLLLRRLGVAAPLDWMAALLFALNGIFTEAVAWPAARFDTLALAFSLVAGLAGLAFLRGTRPALVVSLAATAAACLSKESAYMLPVLLAFLAGRAIRTRAGRVLVWSNFVIAGAVFLWRWLVLKGLGGYLEQTGAPTVLQFDALKLAKTFLLRVWGVLWFPLNWSRPLEVWMMLGLALGIAGSLLLLAARPDRTRIAFCALAVLVACIPTHHMLLIGPSLERSRYLTYATPAFVLLLLTACRGLPRATGIAALALLVTFQFAAQQHNLRIWRSVAAGRYELCRSVAGLARATPGLLAIDGLPIELDGVYWRNGLEDCMDLEFGIPMGKVRVNQPRSSGAAQRFEWDQDSRALRKSGTAP